MRSEVNVKNKIVIIIKDLIMKNQVLLGVSWIRYSLRNLNISV